MDAIIRVGSAGAYVSELNLFDLVLVDSAWSESTYALAQLGESQDVQQPDPQLNEIIRMANSSVQPDKWLESWRYAVGLYVAHYATLFLRSYSPSNETPEKAAASGALVGVVKSATLGDASVTYDTAAITAGTEDWGDLNSTTYGQILANRAKLIGMAGSYVI